MHQSITEERSGKVGSLVSAQKDHERTHTELVVPTLCDGDCRIVHTMNELKPVLYDVASCRNIDLQLPVYATYRNLCGTTEQHILLKHDLRYDVTIMPPLMLGEEYAKTIGHIH